MRVLESSTISCQEGRGGCAHVIHLGRVFIPDLSVLSPDKLPLRTIFTIVSLYWRVLIPNDTWQMEDKPRAFLLV